MSTARLPPSDPEPKSGAKLGMFAASRDAAEEPAQPWKPEPEPAVSSGRCSVVVLPPLDVPVVPVVVELLEMIAEDDPVPGPHPTLVQGTSHDLDAMAEGILAY